MTSKILALFAGLSLVCAAPAVAQTPAPGALTPQRLKLAQDLMLAMGGEAAVAGVIGPGLAGMTGDRTQSTEDAALEQDARTKEIMDLAPAAMDLTAVIYARTFDEKELGELIAFYKKPANSDVTAKASALSDRSAISLIVVMNSVQRELVLAACAKVVCSTEHQGEYENIRPVKRNQAPDPLKDGYDQ